MVLNGRWFSPLAAKFSISAGETWAVEVELDAAGRALLTAHRGRLDTGMTVLKSDPAPVQTHTESVRLVRGKATEAK